MKKASIRWVVAAVLSWIPGGTLVAQLTTRVTVDTANVQPDSYSYYPALSGDGRFVAFLSDATNLVTGDTNGLVDVFVKDRRTGAITRVSVRSNGREANGPSWYPAITHDGRFVAFESRATNLIRGGNPWGVFVHDRLTGVTEIVSVDSAGNPGYWASYEPSLSADGRYVAFWSDAPNLVPTDRNDWSDVFVHDRQTGETILVSTRTTAEQTDSPSGPCSISADGRFVAFESLDAGLVPGDTNNNPDIFVRDLLLDVITRVSIDSAGNQTFGGMRPQISGDGRIVAFDSFASNLVPGDTNGVCDVFVHDRQTGVTRRVSVDSAGAQANGASLLPSLSADGRLVLFESNASNLVPGDNNQAVDVFMHDLATSTTTRVSIHTDGGEGNDHSRDGALSADGRVTAFDSDASNLVDDDTNACSDVFVHGPFLTIEAVPEVVPPGAPVALSLWGGRFGDRALLAVVDVSGAPLFVPVAFGAFSPLGDWTVSGVAPPGLRGLTIGFQGMGFEPAGGAGLSNVERVEFQ